MLNMDTFLWWKYFECKCEPCIIDKQHRIQKVVTHRTQLDLIRNDICEMDKHTHKKVQMLKLKFIYDKSRYKMVYFLKHESNGFKKFQIHKLKVRKST
jgi:hypothetical protein